MQPQGNPAGAPGISWTGREIAALISIWGEKIRQVYCGSRRPKIIVDGFERIAAQMAAHGLRRSALECRTKIGALRRAYRRVFANNSYYYKRRITCPFYAELHRVLRGDGIEPPVLFSRLGNLVIQEAPAPLPGNTGDFRGSGSATSEQENEREVAELSPERRLANTRNRKRQLAGLTDVTQQMIPQSASPNKHHDILEGYRRCPEEAIAKETSQSRSIASEPVNALNNSVGTSSAAGHVSGTCLPAPVPKKRSCVGRRVSRLDL
uniref:myb/SANT-like DNA-binding domain-containing protein 7 n=1 Tax=Euleptes europaea TaxID=460621 RepID=UPI002540B512|nr:myb/SANT-like DNA-binding domain-containing protein 7 [Euleptes europaea]